MVHKRIYKIIILVFVFCGAILFMSQNMKEESIILEKAVAMEKPAFPLMYVETGGYVINRLHGYSGNINANIIREAVTPVSQNKTLKVSFREYETKIKRIKYELRSLKDNALMTSGDISVLDETEEGKGTEIKLDTALNTSTEYAMKITAVTEEGRKIHFYTRIKYYETDYFFKEKLEFVNNFHEKSLDKKKAEELAVYLETDGTEDDTSFAKVTIHSDFDRFSWGNLKPVILTEAVPTIKEFTVETASIQLQYYARVKTDSGEEIYNVKEFYRIRYTSDRMYMLGYERTMDSYFDVGLTSLAKSEFKIGITENKDIDLTTSDENGKVAFVRNGNLWYYDLAKNLLTQVFSFGSTQEDYLRADYDQHDVRILNMDDNGNIDFTVYGYMNRGDYEGKVALILYHFSSDSGLIQEMVYIPLETTYQMLKEDINDFSYVSQRGIFYFTIDNVVYSYNISAKRLTPVVEQVTEDNFAVMEKGHGIAWVEEKEEKTSLILMNLETEEKTEILVPEKEQIRIFGNVGSYVIYGYVRQDDIRETTEGSWIIPAYKLEITGVDGTIQKSYSKKGIYVTGVKTRANIVTLSRAKKSGNGYRTVSENYIISQGEEENRIIGIKSRTTELTRTEYYISMPEGFAMMELPKEKKTENVILREDTTLHLEKSNDMTEKYYVYSKGIISASFDNSAEAIRWADAEMGVVVNHKNRIVWERGGKFNRKIIGQVQTIMAGGNIDSIGACLAMVLKNNQIAADAGQLSSKKQSIYNVLEENLDTPLNLKDCTLDQVLYCVSSGSLVIAMKNSSDAVVITGYDEGSITYIDPHGGTIKTSLTKADTMFSNAGNIFISYMK